MLSGLKEAKGEEFDKLFLSQMITHHQAAIDMAALIPQRTDDPKLIKLGQAITEAQSGEINQMKSWLKAQMSQSSRVTDGEDAGECEMAAFDFEGDYTEEGDFVILRGKIFEAGNYPDKNYSMTAEELAAAATAFTGAKVDYSHVPGPLDGKLGEVTALEVAENGTDLIGTVKMPKWLDTALGATARKVSCTWNKATKTLEKLALVNNPRIPDAVLVSAFAAFEARASKTPETPDTSTTNFNNKNSNQTQTPEAGVTVSDHKEQSQTMSAEFNQVEFDRMKGEIEALKAERRLALAGAFAEAEIKAHRAYPAERASIVAAFNQALLDDEASQAVITFAEGKTGGRAETMRAMFAARPSYEYLTREAVATVEGQILFGNQGNKDKQAEEDAEYNRTMNLTDTGRRAAAAAKAGK